MRRASPQKRSEVGARTLGSTRAARTRTIQSPRSIRIPLDTRFAIAVRELVHAIVDEPGRRTSRIRRNRASSCIPDNVPCSTVARPVMHHARPSGHAPFREARTNAARLEIGSLFA